MDNFNEIIFRKDEILIPIFFRNIAVKNLFGINYWVQYFLAIQLNTLVFHAMTI